MSQRIRLVIALDLEEDGRHIAEIEALPGVMVYGETQDEAVTKVCALALRVIADRLEHGEEAPGLQDISFEHAA